MSGLPETFPCPWCGMTYPAKPVLIGKAVRCKGCRNAFVLQPEGVASKVEDPPPPVAAVPPPAAKPLPPSAVITPLSPPRPPPRPAAPVPAEDDVLTFGDEPVVEAIPLDQPRTPAQPTPPPSRAGSERLAKRKSEHLEAARAQMAAQLAEVAQQAANTEVAKREERRSERLVKAGVKGGPPSGKPASRKAVLTGEGERRHRELVMWWGGLGIAAAVVLLLLFVFSLRSTVRETLDIYAGPVASDMNRYPVLGDVVRSRAWLASAPSMPGGPMLATDLSDASFAAERFIELEPARTILGELKDLRFDALLGVWLQPKDTERAHAAAGERRGDEALQSLAAARIRHVPQRTVAQRLALPSEEDLEILLDLLNGTAPQGSEAFAKRMLDLGEVPNRLVVRNFSGSKGSLLQDIGRPPYRPVQGPYTGTIMRIEGERWPIGWRVLYLTQAK
jgi:hypothetical protein